MALRKPSELARTEPKVVLQERSINKNTVTQLLASAVQKFQDAKIMQLSGPSRLEAAYDAILFASLALFAAQGYRVSSAPGHHRLALEGMCGQLGLSMTLFDEIELLLEVRNTKYTGFLNCSDADLKTALSLGERVLNETEGWFQSTKPDLLK